MRDSFCGLQWAASSSPMLSRGSSQWREGGKLDSAGLLRSTGRATRIPRSGLVQGALCCLQDCSRRRSGAHFVQKCSAEHFWTNVKLSVMWS